MEHTGVFAAEICDLSMRLISLILIMLTLASSARGDFRPFSYSGSAQEAARPPGTLLAYEKIKIAGLFRGRAWRILYSTRDYIGRPILSSGMVLLPDHASKDAARRSIVAWAHPTTGIARRCAPSLAPSAIHTILGLNELVASGHIIAATDYPGLGTEGPIGYMVGKGQANAVIDSVRAARQLPGVGGGSEYALWGYSQGAHAALFATLFGSSYAPELKLVGTAAVAPPTQLKDLMEESFNRLEGRVLASYVLGSWSSKYGLSMEGLVDPVATKSINDINKRCVNNLGDEMEILSLQRPLAQRFLLRSPLAVKEWRNAISTNSVSGLSARVPAIVFQGASDTIVDPRVTTQVVRTSCRNGASIRYVMVEGAGHGTVAKASPVQAINWINDRFAGKPAPSNCR
jgi:alpha-beta hydrolase superfamily lysophospholipase